MSTTLIDRPQPAKKAARRGMSLSRSTSTSTSSPNTKRVKAKAQPESASHPDASPDESATVTTSSSSDSSVIVTEQHLDSPAGAELQISTNDDANNPANTDSVSLSPVATTDDNAASTTETLSSSSSSSLSTDPILDLSKFEPPSPKAQTAVPLLEKLKIKLRPETLARLAELRAMAAEAQPEQPARGNWVPLYPVYARLRSNGYSRDEALDWLVQQGAVAAEHRTRALNALKTLAVRRNKL